ncbi:MAG: alkaline phosphatase D family protein [Gammaproteobacteria bacterium]|nr:alkaline phosphatase D family protein [Gammaproteobacteria bacterium]
MKVKRIKLGPIHCSIGYIDNDSKNRHRFWGKGDDGSTGIIRIKKKNDDSYTILKSFNFIEHYFNTGIIDVPLDPGEQYIAQMGQINTDCTLDEVEQISNLDWSSVRRDTFEFKTFPSLGSNKKTKFILGSCRHHGLIPMNPGNQSDTAFRSIFKKLIDKEKPDFILMTGDQVYADHFLGGLRFNVPPKTQKGYYKKYLKAFKKKYFRKTLSKLPAYMILDDHEVQNDFSIGKFKDIEKEKYDINSLKWGLRAYQSFQSNVSPVVQKDEELTQDYYGDIGYENKPYHYEFYHSNCAFFVMDVRCEREGDLMISFHQKDCLFKFLEKNRNRVRFIVSPVPFFPDTKKGIGAPKDKWAGHSAQRNKILKEMEEANHSDVIFLSGDVHCSFSATIEKQNFRVHSVISSAFNWCVFGLSKNNFIWNGIVRDKNIDSSYKPVLLSDNSKSITVNNFALISVDNSVDNSIVTITYYSSFGKPISKPIMIDINIE